MAAPDPDPRLTLPTAPAAGSAPVVMPVAGSASISPAAPASPPLAQARVGGRPLSFPVPSADEIKRDWPLWAGALPTSPKVPYPQSHWDWSALHARPQVPSSCFIAPGVALYGRVRLGERVSVWYGCVLRGDQEWIEIGDDSNIQDGSILHVEHGGYPCVIGQRVTLGHRAIVHGSIVGDDALIGIGATVLSRCVVGEAALVAAGAVVLEGTHIPPGTLWAGCPARLIRPLTESQQARLAETWKHYVNNGVAHRQAGIGPSSLYA